MAKKSLAEGVFSVQRPQFLTKITLLFCQAFLQIRVNNGHLQFYQKLYLLTIVIVDRDFSFQKTLKAKQLKIRWGQPN